ncbi:nitroreductase family protein [Pseudodesulfovibrio sp.]|uniref:nitroreductase family protein n=1 Tax=Pseudodesulfovibrio sp. TaxID=2035812 RepID=UPI00262EEAE6|nr:nitroreductase family protein [Pseudodesulfovibrio sp.]MDD3313415.1 nitroreductase family protein [Pseudodesulfovibrio sp.]
MDFKDILIRRRAINFFDPERNVDDATLREVLEEAAKAPSSFNLQPWKVMVFRNKERKAELRKLAFDQPKVSEAPVVLMILGDRDGWREGNQTFEDFFEHAMTPDKREWFVNTTKGLYGTNEMVGQAFANKNAGLFAMSLMYAASDLGLHTHPMDGFDHDGIRAAFDIPDNYWIPMLIAVGYAKPGLDIHPKGWRQSPDDMILRTY